MRTRWHHWRTISQHEWVCRTRSALYVVYEYSSEKTPHLRNCRINSVDDWATAVYRFISTFLQIRSFFARWLCCRWIKMTKCAWVIWKIVHVHNGRDCESGSNRIQSFPNFTFPRKRPISSTSRRFDMVYNNFCETICFWMKDVQGTLWTFAVNVSHHLSKFLIESN